MNRTVMALYDDFPTARRVVEALVGAGFDRQNISLIANDANEEYQRYLNDDHYADGDDVSAGEGAGFGAVVGTLAGLGVALIPGLGPVLAAGPLATALMAGIGAAAGAVTGGVVAGLVDLGVPEDEANHYAEGIRRGGALVSIQTDDQQVQRAQMIMNQHNPIDIMQRSAGWRETGYAGFNTQADAWTDTQISAERDRARPLDMGEQDLEVGERDVERSGVRVEQRMSQRSASEDMPLRDDYLHSDRPLSSADQGAFAQGTSYQPYETYETGFRSNFQTNYANSGVNYDQYRPAYRYGYDLAVHDRYTDYDWSRVEPEARRYWEERNPNTWDRIKDSVRHAWDQVRGKA